MADKIIVLDFGSQYNQLIARRIREFGVYSELHPHTLTIAQIEALGDVKGIIFSGGRTVCMMRILFSVIRLFLRAVFRSWVFVMACR